MVTRGFVGEARADIELEAVTEEEEEGVTGGEGVAAREKGCVEEQERLEVVEAVGEEDVVETAVVVGAVGKAVIRVRVGVMVGKEEGGGVEDKHLVGVRVKEGRAVVDIRVLGVFVGVSWAVKEKDKVGESVKVKAPE